MKRLALLLSLLSIASSSADPAVLEGLGVNIHFTQEQPGELDMIHAAGFALVRMDLTWQNIETSRGIYDFSSYDNLVDGIEKRAMKIILIVNYTHRLYDNDQSVFTDDGRAAYASFAGAAAKHFKGKSVIFEIYNEPNIAPFWRPTPDADNYAKMAVSACKAIRAADGNAIIIGPALAGATELDFLETCFKAGLLEYWSAVSVHPYRQTAPETVTEDYRKIRALIHKYAPKDKDIPIVSGEWGFSDVWASFDRDKQATYLARQFLTNLANDIPISIYYDWRDDGLDPKEPEHHFGLVEHTPTGDPQQPFKPKPAYLAAKTLMEQLKGMKFNKKLEFDDPDIQLMMFGEKGALRFVAWTVSGLPKTLSLPAQLGAMRCISMDGKQQPMIDPSGSLAINIDGSPRYLDPDLPSRLLWTLASWSRVPLEVKSFSGVEASVVTSLHNCDDTADLAVITSTQKGGWNRIVIPANRPGRLVTSWKINRFDASTDEIIQIALPGDITFQQKTRSIVSDAVELRLIPLGCNAAVLQLHNPNGYKCEVDVAVKTIENPTQTFGLKVADHERLQETLVAFAPPPAMPVLVWVDAIARNTDRSKRSTILKYAAVKCPPDETRLTFEGDEKIPGEGTLETSDEFPQKEIRERSCVISYHFGAGWKYACVKPDDSPLPIEGQPTKLGIWVYGDKSKNLLRMRFIDSTGQTFQPDGGRLNFNGWEYIEFPMDGSSGGFWGGAKDGKIHYPIKLETLLLIDNASRTAIEGKIHFAAPCLYYDAR
jgi:hypothetical protein